MLKQPKRGIGLLFSLSLRLFLISVHARCKVSDETAQMLRLVGVLAARSCKYCKLGNFRKNFIFAKSLKRHTCDVQNSQLSHDLPKSQRQSDFTISRGSYFQETLHMRSFTKIKPSQKFLICSNKIRSPVKAHIRQSSGLSSLRHIAI